MQNLIIDTEDIDNQVPEIYTLDLVFSSQNQANPVEGRLEKFWKVWEDLGADPWVVSTIKKGKNPSQTSLDITILVQPEQQTS